jgi:hypothetical protein
VDSLEVWVLVAQGSLPYQASADAPSRQELHEYFDSEKKLHIIMRLLDDPLSQACAFKSLARKGVHPWTILQRKKSLLTICSTECALGIARRARRCSGALISAWRALEHTCCGVIRLSVAGLKPMMCCNTP